MERKNDEIPTLSLHSLSQAAKCGKLSSVFCAAIKHWYFFAERSEQSSSGRARPALPLHRKIVVACSKSVCKTPFPARQSVGCSHEESRECHQCYKADGASPMSGTNVRRCGRMSSRTGAYQRVPTRAKRQNVLLPYHSFREQHG